MKAKIVNLKLTIKLLTILFIAGGAFPLDQSIAFSETVTWEQQAERLQHVSATLFDNLPMGEFSQTESKVGIKSVVSMLPKVNPTVGSKSEKVPSSPVHAVPTFQVELFPWSWGVLRPGARFWGGLLPKGSEKLVGLKIEVQQRSFGGSLMLRCVTSFGEPSLELGMQKSDLTAKGAITSLDAEDDFVVNSTMLFSSVSIGRLPFAFWMSGLVANRQVVSQFSIPFDQTSISLTDNDSKLTYQVSIGREFANWLNLGVGHSIVPERVAMTRFFLAANYKLSSMK
ncbi:MAG: hypothetical protein NT027_11680 [Proteobacteria bacterium]|nr:hypothetical protein [Pseudomonadota bacterium]